MMKKFDVIVIGAGPSGLLAAKLLSSTGLSIAILEAQNRIGGRVFTFRDKFSCKVEGGAEFIHGSMPLTFKMIKEYNLTARKRKGKMIRVMRGNVEKEKDFISNSRVLEEKLKEVREDISIAEFIKTFLNEKKHESVRNSLKQFVEGYDAADISVASTLAFREEWLNGDEEQYTLEEGYSHLMKCIAGSCAEKGVEFFFNTAVTEIQWQRDHVKVMAGKDFYSEKVIITVPPALMMNKSIAFTPAVTEYIKEMKGLGFGSVIKILLEFDAPFWKEKELNGQSLSDLGWLFSNEAIPTWWTQYPEDKNILTGWLGGPPVSYYKGSSDKFILNKALQSLSSVFNMTVADLGARCIASAVLNWQNDPFAGCAYSYDTLHSDRARLILREPVEDTLYFAGEALSMRNTGTVEAAFESAVKVAERLFISHRIEQ